MLNPTGEKPLDDIIEKNLDEIMAESVAYQNIQILNRNKIQMNSLK